MKAKNVELISAKYMNEQNPETFEIPTNDELDKISVGSLVKVCANRERFWVEVVDLENDWFIGKVNNVLQLTEGRIFKRLVCAPFG